MIYFDNNATTAIDPKVYAKLCDVLKGNYGNASSLYPLGVSSKQLIEDSRKKIASFIHADLDKGDKILFSSGATESNNSVFHSIFDFNTNNSHCIISSVEHPSVLNVASYYELHGCNVTRIRVDHNGAIDIEQLIDSVSNNTKLVSIMLVNSETGVIHNVEQIVKEIRGINPDILIHTDAVQAAGKIEIDVQKLDVDYLTLSGHKFHAPKGIGILYIKQGAPYNPFILGGHQEQGLRAGTENAASIAALGQAAVIAKQEISEGTTQRIQALRNYMEQRLKSIFQNCIIFGEEAPRVCNTTNIGFHSIDGTRLVLKLAQQGIYISSGTACNSMSAEPSKVLQAMNAPKEYNRSIRISLSKYNTVFEIDHFLDCVKKII